MRKLLARMMKSKFGIPPRVAVPSVCDETAPIFESLAMTEELRDALFPKSPQMVSAIFDRPAPLGRRAAPTPSAASSHSPAKGGTPFPIIF
jgi:hypothetical protein